MFKFPLAVEIDLTNSCNYNCLYCRNGMLNKKEYIDYDDVKKIILELYKNNIFNVNISGGEPTLHPHFEDIIKLLNEYNIVWNLTTNGSLLDKRMAKLLKENNVNSVFITLAGMNDDTDGYIKSARNTYTKAIAAIDNCIRNSIDIHVGYLLTSLNVKDIDKFIEYAKNNNLSVKLMKIKPIGTALFNTELYIDDDTYDRVLNKMKDELGNKLLDSEQNQQIENINCMAGVTTCVIGADYNVYPCVMFLGNKDVSSGSIKNRTLKDIWNNSPVLEEFRSPRIFLQKCNSCSKKNKCKGGCRGNAYLKARDYHLIDGRCQDEL